MRSTSIAVGRWLENGHYTRQPLNDAMSRKFLQTYLIALDYNKLYFTQQDVDEFSEKFENHLDDAMLSGNTKPAFEIFQRYLERVEDRVAKIKEMLAKDYKFTSSRTVRLNRQKLEWPTNMAAADKLWEDIVEADMLRETLNEYRLKPPVETLTKRYNQILRNAKEMDNEEDILKTYFNALAQSYDPHSDYMSAKDLENFHINMNLSLIGVGAVLRSDDGLTKVMEVVPGGPADLEGKLQVGDRIVGVAQGVADFEDVVDMKLDKVVEKIRGKKGSIVRLLVLPANAPDPSSRKLIAIKRDEVKLTEQEARADLLDIQGTDGRIKRIGLITLPMFYSTMNDKAGIPKSTTADVSLLIEYLKKQNIQALVMDIRRNGGGSLAEAIDLTGLFIPRAPVVQVKDANGRTNATANRNPEIAWAGPLLVLTSRMSASASEIFAAALQDYGVAVIVGDERTFGKGTVQTVLDLDKIVPTATGALKFTIQKFYRVKGGSTQFNGVESDIVLPSLTDNPEFSEGSLKNALPYDEVAPARGLGNVPARNLFLNNLLARSKVRVLTDPEFTYSREDAARLADKIEKNEVSLNLEKRKAEIDAEKKRKETRKADRAKRGEAIAVKDYEIILDALLASKAPEEVPYNRKSKRQKLQEVAEAEADGEKPPEDEILPDPIRDEALRITLDLIELSEK